MLAAMGVEHTIEHLTDDHLFSGAARFTPQMPALNACQIAAAVLIGAAQLAPCACRRSAVLTALLRCLPSHAPHPAQTLIIRIPFLAVDIALPEERIAIEVDGPHHFTTNTFRRLGEMYCRCAALAAGFRARFQFVAVQFGQTAAVRLRTSADLPPLLPSPLLQAHAAQGARLAGCVGALLPLERRVGCDKRACLLACNATSLHS